MANADNLRTVMRERAGQVIDLAAGTIAHLVQGDAPVRTGALRDSVTVTEPAVDGDQFEVTIATPLEYASWQNSGTGVWGPTGSPIRPVRARYLRWMGPEGPIFRLQVAGTPPTWFWNEHVNPDSWTAAIADALR